MPSINKSKKDNTAGISSPLEPLLGYQLRRASREMRDRLSARYEQIGLRLIEASILIMINENPGIKQSQLSNVLHIKSANMTPMVAFLEQSNHIIRKRLDGRSQGLFLSTSGEETIKQIWKCVDENEKWLAACLQGIEKDSMIESLRKIWS